MPEVIAGRYELLSDPSPGPFGTVYRARHTFLDTRLRLTLLDPALADRADVVAAFRTRAAAAVGLEHRHMVRVLDVGLDGTRYYLAEDLVAGPDLAERLAKEGPVPPGQAMAVVARLGRALSSAHERGVVHGSVHAGAVVVEDGDLTRVRLGGFGTDPRWLAAALRIEVRAALAPEAAADARTDVFGLGRLLMALSGGTVPGPLQECIARATAPAPSARHPDVRSFLAELSTAGRSFASDVAVILGPGDVTALGPLQKSDDPTAVISRLRAAQGAPMEPPTGARSWWVLGLPGTFNFPWWIVGLGALVGVAMATRTWYLRSAEAPTAPLSTRSSPTTSEPAVARPATPASTVPAPLAWSRALPPAGEATVSAGQPLEFAAEVAPRAGGTPPTYTWFVDGHEVASGPTFTYHPDATSADATAEVRVAASAPPQTLERRWQVHVLARRELPALVAASPESPTITVAVGTQQRFEVMARQPSGLTYTWEENGTVRASGPEPSWTLRPAGPGESEVRVTAVDASGASGPPRVWKVTVVRNLPPRIASQRPAAAGGLVVAAGDSIQLAVRAVDPNPGDPLAYRWFLDGREVSGLRSWRFTAPQAPGSHRVEVEVADRAGLRSPRAAWVVDVTPKMREVDVREWLDRLRAAFERKDVATLRLYGVVSSDDEAAAVKRALGRYDDYRVVLRNPVIKVDGRYASVSVERTETADGRTVASSRQAYQLEKHANGLVTLRGVARQ